MLQLFTQLLSGLIIMSGPPDQLLEKFENTWPYCLEVAEETGMDPYLLCGVAGYESLFDNSLIQEESGACCAMQVMPGYPGRPTCKAMRRDPLVCMRAGAAYLQKWLEKLGCEKRALCHYNCGNKCYPGSLRQYSPGVLWMADLVRRYTEGDPYGFHVCRITLPMRKVDGTDDVLVSTGVEPVYGGPGKWSHRGTVRHYRQRRLDALCDHVRYTTCRIHRPDNYSACTHAPGRRTDHAYVPIDPVELSQL